MKLQREEFEQRFEKYRDNLRNEVHRFRDAASVLRQINERLADHLSEINLAPGFFHVVEDSLFTTIVLWADKLFDECGERGVFNFLSFVEYNRDWLAIAELKRRKGYPDDHWMVKDRVPITFESIEEDRARIRSLAALPSIRLLRDKFHGHFDKDYFFDRSRLHSEAPITWAELSEAGEVMGTMLNNYSTDFDGVSYSWKGPADLGALLQAACRSRGVHAD